jgi:hypothetical protein
VPLATLTKLFEAAVKLCTAASSYPDLLPTGVEARLLHHHIPANVAENMMEKYRNKGTMVRNTGPRLSRM